MGDFNKYLEVVKQKPEIKKLLDFKLSPYIPHEPTPKQSAFLWLDNEEAFFGGAGHSLDTLILTPFGFRKLGSLKIGDLVTTPDNKKAKIFNIIKLGIRKLYEVTLNDGSKIKATDDHLWKYRKCVGYRSTWQLGTTIDVILQMCNGTKIEIPTTEPLDFANCENEFNKDIIFLAMYRALYLKNYLSNCVYDRSVFIKYNDNDELKRIKAIVQSLGGFAKQNGKTLRIAEAHKQQKRYIHHIEEAKAEEAWCLQISHPDGLYLANDFIVTHNCGGGKSDCLLMAALQYVDIPGYNALLIRDTYQNLIKPEGLITRSLEWLTGSDAKWVDKQRAWIFPSGASLSFGYLDGPRDEFNYQGAAYQFIGFDEAVALREHQVNFLFSRLRKKTEISYANDLNTLDIYKELFKNTSKEEKEKKIELFSKQYKNIPLRLRLASNPPLREQVARGEWVKRRYVDKNTKEKDVIFIPSKLSDNPHVDEKTYKKSLSRLDPIMRMKLEDGDWDVSEKGEMFQKEWWKFVKVAPVDCQWVRYWDLAATEESKKNKKPCFTAGVKMGKDSEGRIYIAHIERFRSTPFGNETIIKNTAIMDGVKTKIYQEQEPGSSGKNTIDNYQRKVLSGFIFKGIKPTGSKIERAMPFASAVESGNVYIVEGDWNKAFIDECELFPDSDFKDQVDGAAGAYEQLTTAKVINIRRI